jgi:Asparagine synthase (glutamine-hydrolyzing)
MLAHRGPDAEGTWMNSTTALGNRRLSIIDLSSAGNQPMHYLDRYTIIHNGEIYNYIELKEELQKKGYSFFSKTDTESLLHLMIAGKKNVLIISMACSPLQSGMKRKKSFLLQETGLARNLFSIL